jgi:hypothetical protein
MPDVLKSRAVALIAAAALIASLSISSAAAAPHKRAAGGATGALITFDRAQVMVGETYHVNGSGFRPNTWVTVGAYFADTTWWNSQITDGSGRFSLAFTASSAGSIYHEAKERGNNGRLRLRATATLTAYPAS